MKASFLYTKSLCIISLLQIRKWNCYKYWSIGSCAIVKVERRVEEQGVWSMREVSKDGFIL